MDSLLPSLVQSPAGYLPAAGAPRSRTVGELASVGAVKVPSWFTIGAALRVARLKNVSHVLVTDRHTVVGSIAVDVMAHAPGADTLARWMTASDVTISADAPEEEAQRLMSRGLDCLPVVSGAILLGIITRADLASAVARWEAAE
jgi:CBS domain-containing protein